MGYSLGLTPARLTNLFSINLSLSFAQEQNNNFSAEKSYIYPVDARSNNITVTPPSSASQGDRFAIFDSRATAATNNITIDLIAASALFHGSAQNYVLNQETAYAEFLFIGENIGWIVQK